MLTENKLKELLNRNENPILDFKEAFYDFDNGDKNITTAKFVKDIISFSNTIRTENAYIIFGVKEKEKEENELISLEKISDDSILQEKVKDKLFPRPKFEFHAIRYKNNNLAYIEFPIFKYEIPITSIVNGLKGLEKGKVYFRNGSSNTEANSIDIIRINDWLRSLPKHEEFVDSNSKIASFLKQLTDVEINLSTIIPDLYSFAKNNSFSEIEKFCIQELKGIQLSKDMDTSIYNYRNQKVYTSWNKIEVNPYSFVKINVEIVKKEFDSSDDFFVVPMLIHHSLVEVEDTLSRLKENPNSYATIKTNSNNIVDMEKKFEMYIYLFPDNYMNLYKNIRQQAIDLIMKI